MNRAIETVGTWLQHGRASFGRTIPSAAMDEVLRLAAQGIEARQGGNAESGAIEDESPAGEAGVPNPGIHTVDGEEGLSHD